MTRSCRVGAPREAEESYQVRFVLLPQLDRGCVRVQVLVAVRQHGAALRDLDDQARGIGGVDDDRVAEGAPRHQRRQSARFERELFTITNCGEALELRAGRL